MEELRYWVWLSQCFAYGSAMPAKLLEVCPSPKTLFEMSEEELQRFSFLPAKDRSIMKKTTLSNADFVLKQCARFKIRIIPMTDPEYPVRLRNIYGPPVVLYVLGSLTGLDDEPTVAIVGTRSADEYALAATEFLASGIARAGAVIVSGCAHGIDSAAHEAAIAANRRTIAVLACGLDVDYPTGSGPMKRAILNGGGALVSEYPPGTPSAPRVFQVRNRIISGLSLGVLVTQAPVRSGALLTAGHAVDQGRDLFCLPPNSIFDRQYAGVIRYLRDGAIPVFSPEDVLLPYYAEFPDKIDLAALKGDPAYQKIVQTTSERAAVVVPKKAETKKADKKTKITDKTERNKEKTEKNPETVFDELHSLVYNQLDTHPQSIDDLTAKCGIDIGTLYSVLTDLELDGYIEPLGGGRYHRVD